MKTMCPGYITTKILATLGDMIYKVHVPKYKVTTKLLMITHTHTHTHTHTYIHTHTHIYTHIHLHTHTHTHTHTHVNNKILQVH